MTQAASQPDISPVLQASYLRRSQILAAFEERAAAVNILVGPPGSGKTCTLFELWQAMTTRGERVAWLSLAPSDNVIAVLQHRLDAACHGADVLFVDGLHHIVASDCRVWLEHALFEKLLACRLFLASRHLPGASFHQALLAGRVTLIGPEMLRFTDMEARQLLGGRLFTRQAEQLNHLADGWAAGLRMLSLDPDMARALAEDMSGQRPIPKLMAAYFDDVVCASLPPDQLAALLEISVFERFSAEALAAMPLPGRNWQDIEPLLRANFFVRFFDESRLWAVFQPAFSRYLRQRFRQAEPQRYEQLRAFAADWFEKSGHAAEAVRHAVSLADHPIAARIIEKAGAIAVDVGEGPDVALGDLIAPEEAGTLPLAFLGQVYYRIRQGRLREARVQFESGAALTANFTRLSSQADPLIASGWYALIRVVFKAADDLEMSETDLALLETALANQINADPVLAASFASVLAFVYLDLSRYAEAATICSIGMSALDSASAYKATIFIRQHQASAALAHDTYDSALLCAEDAMRLAQIEGTSGGYEIVTCQITRGILHYENNELDQALALLQPALGHLHAVNGWGRLYVEAFTIAADAASILHGRDAAEKLIRAGEGFARHRNLVRLINHVAISRLSGALRAGEWRDAQKLLVEAPLAGLLASSEPTPYILVQQVPAQLKATELMLEIGRPRQALVLLDQVNKAFLQDADNRLRIGFHLLAMRAAFAARRFNAAVQHMQTGVDLARQSGLIRRILDGRAHVLEVFDWSLRNGRQSPPAIAAYVRSVLQPADASTSGTRLAQNAPRRGTQSLANNFALSPRESEIIALIAEGLSAKEIANRLDITEGTVKSHRKKIHEKLGVTTRSQAIQRARELLIV